VAVAVQITVSRRAVHPAEHLAREIKMSGIDTGIDHRNLDAVPLIRLVLGVDAIDAGWKRLKTR
jgi:hypothetical protein